MKFSIFIVEIFFFIAWASFRINDLPKMKLTFLMFSFPNEKHKQVICSRPHLVDVGSQNQPLMFIYAEAT